MNNREALDHLGPIADEMLAGMHADETMKRRIQAAAMENSHKKTPARAFVPAICCAALAVAILGTAGLRLSGSKQDGPVNIGTIAAGDPVIMKNTQVADLGDNAMVKQAPHGGTTLFAAGQGDIPMVTVDGAVYHMLTKPSSLDGGLLAGEVGSIAAFEEQPSLASSQEMQAGLSNVAAQGAVVYAVSGLDVKTAVAAEVDGRYRLFQRVSYAGKGPGTQSLEDTFSVRGQVAAMELSGVGTLTGETANRVMNVLLDQAALKAADMSSRKQTLTVTLNNGLKLQLGVSGDTLCGCGGWSCPEFFEAFETAL